MPGSRSDLVLVKRPGLPDETRQSLEGIVQPEKGFFDLDAPVEEGDVVEVPDPRRGTRTYSIKRVEIFEVGRAGLDHIEVEWGVAPQVREAAVRRLGIEGLHPEVVAVASDLFTDGHYSQAVFEAFKAVEVRVRRQSGLAGSGQDLMARAFATTGGPIRVAMESGQSGDDEQEGFRFIFMGAMRGIRNPKGHELVSLKDPQRALEYLALASLLMRRLDDATP